MDCLPYSRRDALKLLASGAALWLTSPTASFGGPGQPAAESEYRVGVGSSTDPYHATLRAIEASGDWPQATVSRATVVIKPNLVIPRSAKTGATTNPQVVRALVDMALDSGAARILVVEGGAKGPNFSGCGYDFFSGYDQRVALLAMNRLPVRLCSVADAMAYRRLYLPALLLEPEVLFISAAKMKTHGDATVSLSMKNLFGLPPAQYYKWPGDFLSGGRFTMHDRSVSQTIVDLNLARSVDFAVVDAIWAMEGPGPFFGDPVRMNVVLAGSNAIAVDRACLQAMGIAQDAVQHLRYAAAKGLGPGDTTTIELVGDVLSSHRFKLAEARPVVEMPRCQPASFGPGIESVAIAYEVDRQCKVRVDIVRTSDVYPSVRSVQHIRTLQPLTTTAAGEHSLAWDGHDGLRSIVTPGRYGVRVRARLPHNLLDTFAINWVQAA